MSTRIQPVYPINMYYLINHLARLRVNFIMMSTSQMRPEKLTDLPNVTQWQVAGIITPRHVLRIMLITTSQICVCVSVCVCMLSRLQFFVTPWTVAHQPPLLMEFSRARILELVAISHSKGSSWSRDQTRISCVSCIGRQILNHLAPPSQIYHS